MDIDELITQGETLRASLKKMKIDGCVGMNMPIMVLFKNGFKRPLAFFILTIVEIL